MIGWNRNKGRVPHLLARDFDPEAANNLLIHMVSK